MIRRVLRRRICRILGDLGPLLSLLVVQGVAAQDTACAAFDALHAGMQEAHAAFLADESDERFDVLRAVSQKGAECATSDSERAAAYNYLTWALHRRRMMEEALGVFEAFERLTPTPGDSATWSRMYERYGYALLHDGRYIEAHRAIAEGFGFATSLPLTHRLRLLFAQADALGRAGAWEESLPIFERIESVLEAEGEGLDPANHAFSVGRLLGERASALHQVAFEHRTLKEERLERAHRDARRAVDVLDRPEPFVARERIIARLILAMTLRALDREAEALAHVREAVEAADADGNESLRAEAWMDLGITHLALGDAESALAPLRKALGLALEIGDQYKAQYSFLHLGRAFERLGDDAEAEGAYREAIARVEEQRLKMGTTERAATGFKTWEEPYRDLVGLYLRTGREHEAFSLLEQTRARYLTDLRRARESIAHLGPEARARLDSLDAEIERLRTDLLTDPDPTSPPALRLSELIVQRYGPGANVSEYTPPALPVIQRALGRRGQTLVSYFIADPSYAFVLTPDALHAVRLDVTEAAVDSLMQGVSPLWHGEAETRSRDAVAYDTGALHGLHLALFAPLRHLLPPGTPLVITPDGSLRELPFAMLLEAPTPRFQYADAPFLLRRHPISMELAASFLVEPDRQDMEWEHDLLAFGRSEFDLPASVPRRSGDGPFPDLPSVRDEIGALRQLFRRAVVALDEQASEAALLTQMASAQVIHIASHAAVDAERPLYSRIELWPDSAAGDDGRLHLFELAGRDVPAELVVLSGCSTARGQVLGGEGAMGLHYGFRAAGSHASLGTLWYVDDRATGALMTRFYHHLRTGLSKDRALQQAQLDYLDTAEGLDASPFFWAAPVLYGSPAAIAWADPPSPSPVAWTGIGGILLLLGLALPRIRGWRSGRMDA